MQAKGASDHSANDMAVIKNICPERSHFKLARRQRQSFDLGTAWGKPRQGREKWWDGANILGHLSNLLVIL